jgi:hypothetical protein
MATTPAPQTEIAIAATAGILLAAATLAGATAALGAHPWWAIQSGLVGTAGGLALYGALRALGVGAGRLGLVAAMALVASALAAHFGKQSFVASFASDALAGRLWYLGWFVLAGSATVVLTVLAARVLRR